MLRIGFDAKRAFLNHTGLGNYSRSVINSLAHFFPENQYFLYTPKEGRKDITAHFLQYKNVTICKPAISLLSSLWRSRFVVKQLLKDKIDIYHGLSHEIPITIHRTNIKTVVTIHDLIFLRYPHYYKVTDRKIYELKFRNACRHAHLIIAISEQTKRDIIHYFGIEKEKINVVYQSCAPEFAIPCGQQQLSQIQQKYNLPSRFLLNVGTIEDRKNLMLVVKALSQIPDQIKLVVIGKETPYAVTVKKYLKDNGLQDRVLFLQGVSFHDLPAIYQQSDIFVYPSEFEGFGIPILEALNSGIPIIAATGSCLEEAGGPSSLYVAPDNPEALAAAINKILDQPGLRNKMVEDGKKYALHFTENAHAENLMRIYKSL